MNEEQMQAAVNQLMIDLLGKGIRKAKAFIWIAANEQPNVSIGGGEYGEVDHWYEYPRGETVGEAIEIARAIIAKMPDATTRQMQTFMAALGKVIDLGRDNSIDVDFLNPLTATMKALSENIITDQREAKE